MIDAGILQKLLAFIGSLVTSPLSFLLLLLVFLLLLGAILDIFSAIVLVVPLILPVATQFGIHPVHLGIMFLATMQLGYLTPPVGLNLFIASYRFDRSIVELYLSTLPFFLCLLFSVAIIAFWPWLSLVLIR
jgi:TRAP-type C4-dicarboxylate transport system permease large subunit